jgi:hypothetical protein
VHLPLADGSYTQVLVSSDKVYGLYSGKDLINMYRTRPAKQKPVSNPVVIRGKDIILRLPTGPLPDTIQIQEKPYRTRDFISTIEKATGIRILSKRCNRALKHMQNTSLKLPINLLHPFFK